MIWNRVSDGNEVKAHSMVIPDSANTVVNGGPLAS